MISVGIDVAKGKSTICILKPYGEIVSKPFDVAHTEKDLNELSSMLLRFDDEVKVVMEATGIYHLPVLTYLQEKGIFVAVINPYLMKMYRSGDLRKAKTDKIDSKIIANYGIEHWFTMKEFQASEEAYSELRLLGQQYRHYMKLHIMSLHELIHLLDYTMPGIKGMLASWNEGNRKDKLSDFVERFWHYDMITRLNESEFIEQYKLWAKEKSVLFAVFGIAFIKPIAAMLGAEGELIDLCALYGRIILVVLPFFMLQNMFQSFLIVAEKPNLGLAITVIAGATNMVLDALFMIVFKWGVAGAALATAASQFIGGFIPVVYFARKDSSTLKLVKARFDGRALFQASTNGSSEFVSNISMSIVAVLYNFQLMKYAGENGVAPIIGYNQGAENHIELQNVFKKSMVFNTVAGIALTTVAVVLAAPLSKIFVGYDAELLEMTTHAFKLYAISFLFTGFGIFGSSLFTALNNGLVSAIISFLRTLVFQVVTILILPSIWGIEGIWYSIIVAEFLGAAVAIVYILKYKKKYRY